MLTIIMFIIVKYSLKYDCADREEMGNDTITVSMHDSLVAVARHVIAESRAGSGTYITNSLDNDACSQVCFV